MGEFYWKLAKQEQDCSERHGGVGIVQVRQGEKYTPEGPQVGRKKGFGTRNSKTGQTGRSGGSVGYQTCNLGGDG